MTDIGPRGPASTFWADPRREKRLREMAAEGLTSGLMASALGCSRNSIISKAHREGIQLRPPYVGGDRPRVRSVAGPRPAAKLAAPKGGISHGCNNNTAWRIANGLTKGHVGEMPRQAPSEPAQPVPATAVTIFGLTDRTCRWPLFSGNEPIGDKLYCGGDVVGASGGCWDRMMPHLPYCGHHARMAYAPPRTGPARRMEAAE